MQQSPLDPEQAAQARASRLLELDDVDTAEAKLTGDTWAVEVTTSKHGEPVQVVDDEDEAWLLRDFGLEAAAA